MLAAAVAAAGGYAWQHRTAAAPHYLTAAADRGAIVQAVVAGGTVNPVTTIQVGTYVSGVVEAVLCDFNTQVKAGQLCARIDPRPYQSAVEQAEASLATARAQLEKDQANLNYTAAADRRNAELIARGFVSQETADASHNAYRQARAQLALDQAGVAQHVAQLKAARINLGYTDIVSPVSGTVVSRNVAQGQTVAASFQTPTLFLIAADLAKMQVDTNVSESDIGRVAAGNAAVFTVLSYPERQFTGQVLQVRQAPQTVQNVITYDVVIGVPNPDLALKPGMTAALRIETRRVDHALRVPVQALRFHPTGQAARTEGLGAHVWLLVQGKPHQAAVTVGLDDDNYAQITGGSLREGDQVIVAEQAQATADAPRGQRLQPALAPVRR